MTTKVAEVKHWYEQNASRLREMFIKPSIRATCDEDQVKGKVLVELETAALVSTITLWNKGDVEVLGANKSTQKDFVIDDRVLSPGEDIPELMEAYVRKILGTSDPP